MDNPNSPNPNNPNPAPPFPGATPPPPTPSAPPPPSPSTTLPDMTSQFTPQPPTTPADTWSSYSPPSTAPTQTASPLDNPWNVPIQPPPIDGPQPAIPDLSATPTFPSTPVEPAVSPAPIESGPTTPPASLPTAEPAPAAPTDLSHLITNLQPQAPAPDTSGLGLASPGGTETLVIPSATPEVPTVPTENHKSIPKWLIGLGIGLLIIVAGASAYFIMGIGQPPKTTTSVPATTQASKQDVKAPPPIATPVAQPAATDSASFGQLQGGDQTATSAADLLRRQQGR